MANPNGVFPSNSSGAEANMRQEMMNTLFGSAQETAKSHNTLLRRMRLDGNGDKIKCPCVDRVTQEADSDYFCPVCLGERYLWDETLISCYLVGDRDVKGLKSKAVGLIPTHDAFIYLPYNIQVKQWDKVVDINLDVEGGIIQPIKRYRVWQITDVLDYRADNGKLEFIVLAAREQDVRYYNNPGK